jgi:hypothetical protein
MGFQKKSCHSVRIKTGIPIIGSLYLATPSEGLEVLVFTVAICEVCRLVREREREKRNSVA